MTIKLDPTSPLSNLRERDRGIAKTILGKIRPPDLTISPDGTPYLYRWHIIPRNQETNVYLHLQVTSDPERPLHDHPWDNQSVILAGGYKEIVQWEPPWQHPHEFQRWTGDVISRKAEEAHRLILPTAIPYTLTLFTTGPVRRDWGFWINNHKGRADWYSHKDCIIETKDGRALWRTPASAL